jgi:hypothetical protein
MPEPTPNPNAYRRPCDCPHSFPVCACFEGLSGAPLEARSRWLSSLAGWPARVEFLSAADVVRVYGRPAIPPESIARANDCGCGDTHR